MLSLYPVVRLSGEQIKDNSHLLFRTATQHSSELAAHVTCGGIAVWVKIIYLNLSCYKSRLLNNLGPRVIQLLSMFLPPKN